MLDDFDPVLCLCQITLQSNDNFFVTVTYLAQGCKFPFSCFWCIHRLCNLDIFFLICFCGNKVHFLIVYFPDGYIIAPAHQFKENNILQNMSAVSLPESQQIVSQANIYNVILS